MCKATKTGWAGPASRDKEMGVCLEGCLEGSLEGLRAWRTNCTKTTPLPLPPSSSRLLRSANHNRSVYFEVNLPILTEDTHARVGRAQINTDGRSHLVCVFATLGKSMYRIAERSLNFPEERWELKWFAKIETVNGECRSGRRGRRAFRI